MSARDRLLAHWREDSGGGALDAALLPAALAFRGLSALFHAGYDRGWRRQVRLTVPVISVGNLTVGGTGKTPFSRWLVEKLRADGRRPALLHGGYGQDEPALHREWNPEIPVFAARDRIASGRAAIAGGTDVLVLDDGFQHRRLARSLDIALVSADSWTERRAFLPRGPWREPLTSLGRADVVVVMRKTATAARAADVAAELRSHLRADAALAGAVLEPAGWRAASGLPGEPPAEGVAVSAIADPGSFEAQAEAAGVRLADRLRFPDHHGYTAADAEAIRKRAGGQAILCTGKDWVKLRHLLPPDDVWVLEQRLHFDFGVDALMAGIERAVQ